MIYSPNGLLAFSAIETWINAKSFHQAEFKSNFFICKWKWLIHVIFLFFSTNFPRRFKGYTTPLISVKETLNLLKKDHSKEFPDVAFQFWRFLTFSVLIFSGTHSYTNRKLETVLPSKTSSRLSTAWIRFFSKSSCWGPDHDKLSKLHCTSSAWIFLPPSPCLPFVWYSIVLYKEVTSSICTSVAILATVIRLFVRRLVFWFDDVSSLQGSIPTYLQNLFVDEHIVMRSAEYVTPNCSYGNHRWHRCVVNRDELQLIHVNWTLDRSIYFLGVLHHTLFYVLLYRLVGRL